MSIKKISGTITKIVDLSQTAKEVTIAPSNELHFIAGSFVNLFMDIDGKIVRRAYSISSSDRTHDTFTLSIRRSLQGTMTPLFWKKDQTGVTVELMGPLGINTADKMRSKNICLFAFGVGAGVVKSLLDHFAKSTNVSRIIVMTGSRSVEEILYKDYFDRMAEKYAHIEVTYVVSQPELPDVFKKGYIQDHIKNINFNNADVYACGQEVACEALVAKIREGSPLNCHFFIEAFH